MSKITKCDICLRDIDCKAFEIPTNVSNALRTVELIIDAVRTGKLDICSVDCLYFQIGKQLDITLEDDKNISNMPKQTVVTTTAPYPNHHIK